MEYDAQRTSVLAAVGIYELRFWNNDVLENTEEVLRMIWDKVQERLP